MQLVQWIHKIAKASSIMYPGYKDKLYLTKLFLNTLILGNETMEYGKKLEILRIVCVTEFLLTC